MVSVAKPHPSSKYASFIDESITYLKKSRNNAQEAGINATLGDKLVFLPLHFQNRAEAVSALVDTGATTSLLHVDIAKQLNLQIKPLTMTLNTATGSSASAILGYAHAKFFVETTDLEYVPMCTVFIISNVLNNLQCIVGAEILLNEEIVKSISGSDLHIYQDNKHVTVPIYKQSPGNATNSVIADATILGITNCQCNETEDHIMEHALAHEASLNSSHVIKQDIIDETLPESQQLFDDNYELEPVDLLKKKFTIHDGDFSQVPSRHFSSLMKLLEEFKDRFSSYKLDLEITDLY